MHRDYLFVPWTGVARHNVQRSFEDQHTIYLSLNIQTKERILQPRPFLIYDLKCFSLPCCIQNIFIKITLKCQIFLKFPYGKKTSGRYCFLIPVTTDPNLKQSQPKNTRKSYLCKFQLFSLFSIGWRSLQCCNDKITLFNI